MEESYLVPRQEFEQWMHLLIASVDASKADYGCEYNNEVFSMRPYFWGECKCENAPSDISSDHDEDCPVYGPNFHYKPSDYKIWWYKYPLRGANANQKISVEKFKRIIQICIASVNQDKLIINTILEESVKKHADLWKKMADSITCGYCGKVTTVDSGHQCRCGRILCEDCGERWGWCKDHVPLCNHPELLPSRWNQPRPKPAKMTGNSRHNMCCPVCGFGWGQYPDPYFERKKDGDV